MKAVKERDNMDLLELVLQLHSRALHFPSKEMSDAYNEARNELTRRLDESTPAEDCEAVYLHVDYNTLRTLELTEDAIPRWEEDGSMEKGDRLYKATLIKTY